MAAFLLIRHAQSTWNAGGRWQGQADPPLSESGEASAARAAERLACGPPFDLVITSDLTRARRTGEILAAGGAMSGPTDLQRRRSSEREARLPASREGWAESAADRRLPTMVVEPSLREFHVGAWSGLTRAEIEARWPNDLDLFDAGRLPAPPGGESRGDFDARVRGAALAVARMIRRHGARRALVVTHGGVIRSLLRSSGLPERHVTNLAGYEGAAMTEGLCLDRPVDLLERGEGALSGGPAIL